MTYTSQTMERVWQRQLLSQPAVLSNAAHEDGKDLLRVLLPLPAVIVWLLPDTLTKAAVAFTRCVDSGAFDTVPPRWNDFGKEDNLEELMDQPVGIQVQIARAAAVADMGKMDLMDHLLLHPNHMTQRL